MLDWLKHHWRYLLPPLLYGIWNWGNFFLSFLFMPLQSLQEHFMFLIGVTVLFIFLLVWVVMRYYHGAGIRKMPLSLSNLAFFFGLLLLDGLLSYWIVQHLPTPANQAILENIYYASRREGAETMMWMLGWATVSPVWEEFFFRSLLMETYFRKSPYYLDVLVSTLLFSLAHLSVGFSWTGFLGYSLKGLVFPIIYRKTQSIYYPIFLHLISNFGGNVLLDWLRNLLG